MKSLGLILPGLLFPLLARAQAPAAPPPAPRPTGPHLSLEAAIAHAEQIHPSLAADQASAEAALARIDQVRASTRPQVNGNASIGGNLSTPTAADDPHTSLDVNVKGSWLITDFGRTTARRKAAEASALAARDQVAVTGLDVRTDVETAYLLAIAQRELVDVAVDAETAANRHLDEAHRFVLAGAKDPIEEATAAATAAAQKAARIRAEGSYQAAIAELRLAVGDPSIPDDVSLDETWPGALDGEDQARDALVANAMAHRPELMQAQLAIQAAEESRIAASYGHRPTVSVGASVDWSRHDKDIGDPFWTAGLTLSVPIFDGGLIAAQTREAEANKTEAMARRAQEALSVRSDVESAWIDLRSDQAALESSKAAVTAARQQLTLAEGRYTAGVGSPVELADAQNAVVNAEGQRVTAEWQLATARTRLRRALGQ
ncbi:MAG TPA: TolC family protein [Kofleriaceae bacterium]|jgi:outer membrane protein|nr:TolC family protein [Kofleriaceae bacterium]